MKMAILELEYKNIRKITALKLPFTKADGSVISNNFIMMANGTGKTTTMELIKGLFDGTAAGWTASKVRSFAPTLTEADTGEFSITVKFDDRQYKFIQFDVYYCCALIGMAAGQIDEDTSELKDLVERYPVQYRDCKAQIAGLLVASEARRLGIDTQSPKLEQIMLQYISNNDTLLSEDGIKTLNAYALKGYRLITDYPLFDKPTSREEFLDAFNVAMQFYEKKDS